MILKLKIVSYHYEDFSNNSRNRFLYRDASHEDGKRRRRSFQRKQTDKKSKKWLNSFN